MLLHHGTADDTCPIAWSRTTQSLLREAGVRSRLDVYDGEQHAFGPQWPESMRRTVAFLRRELRAEAACSGQGMMSSGNAFPDRQNSPGAR